MTQEKTMLGSDALRLTRLFHKTGVRNAMPSEWRPERHPRLGGGLPAAIATISLGLLFGVGALAQQQETAPIGESKGSTITTFDVTGAGNAAGQGTFSKAINSKGVVAGFYFDSGNVEHGFTRAANGTIATLCRARARELSGNDG